MESISLIQSKTKKSLQEKEYSQDQIHSGADKHKGEDTHNVTNIQFPMSSNNNEHVTVTK